MRFWRAGHKFPKKVYPGITKTLVRRKVGRSMASSAVSYAPNLSRTPVRRAVLPHSSARHGPAHVAHVHASLMSRSLGLVGRREPSAMTLIRARDADGWPTFREDEERLLDGARVLRPTVRQLVKPHTAGACYHVSPPLSRVLNDHCKALGLSIRSRPVGGTQARRSRHRVWDLVIASCHGIHR